MSHRNWVAGVFCAAAAGGCQSPAARGPAPAGCSAHAADAPLLQLAATHAPANLPGGKSAPYQYAVALPVNQDLEKLGRWNDAGGDWSVLALRVASDGATSLAMHFKPLQLPAEAQVWLCSSDGSLRQGPLSGSGELQTPVVRGGEARIEILAPADLQTAVHASLAEAYGGFR